MFVSKNAVNFIVFCTSCVLLILIVDIILYPDLFSYYAFSILISEEDNILQTKLSSQIKESIPTLPFYLFTFLFNWLRWLLPLSILLKIYMAKKIRVSYAVTLSIILVILSVVVFATENRAESIYIMVPFFLMLIKIYPTYKKRLYAILGGLFFMVGIMGLILKSYGDDVDTINLQGMADLLQAYFSGPDNVAVGLMLPVPTFEILMGDIFKHIPYVMFFLKDFSNSLIQFNYIFFKEADITTQIIPMISQGQRYFTFIGAPIFTYIFCYIAFKLEKKANSTQSLLYFWLNIIHCTFLPFAMVMYWFSQCLTIWLGVFLPTILLLRYTLKKY